MSIVQERRLELLYTNASTYLTASSSNLTIPGYVSYSGSGANGISNTNSTTYQYAILNSSAKNYLFPNNTAHPVSYSCYITSSRTAGSITEGSWSHYSELVFDGTSVESCSGNSWTSKGIINKTNQTNSVLNSLTRSSEIKIGLKSSKSNKQVLCCSETSSSTCFLSFKFNLYGFTAIADTGIASATATQSGYDGDSIMFTCTVSSGYTFDGWYNGSTKVSSSQTYTHTVNGSDLSLTAKATQSSRILKVYYNGNELSVASQSVTSATNVTYKGATLTTVALGSSKILNCSQKFMQDNLKIGSKTLNCAGKIMSGNVVVTIT